MPHTKESTVLPTEEVTHGDPQEDGDAEQTTPPQQADAGEQVGNVRLVPMTHNSLPTLEEVYPHEGSLKKEKLC